MRLRFAPWHASLRCRRCSKRQNRIQSLAATLSLSSRTFTILFIDTHQIHNTAATVAAAITRIAHLFLRTHKRNLCRRKFNLYLTFYFCVYSAIKVQLLHSVLRRRSVVAVKLSHIEWDDIVNSSHFYLETRFVYSYFRIEKREEKNISRDSDSTSGESGTQLEKGKILPKEKQRDFLVSWVCDCKRKVHRETEEWTLRLSLCVLCLSSASAHSHRRIMNVNQQANETMVPMKENQASHYALHVALQTMKERCLALQQRLTSVEEENLALRLKYGADTPKSRSGLVDISDINRSEADQLRDKVGELTRQKHQLTEHIGMVASENRQLWSRLSKLTKDNQSLGISLNKIKDTLTGSGGVPAHQNLIRSKTFTQNSPNPILRQKLLQDQCGVDHAKSSDNVSMEEIVLKDFDDTKDDVTAVMRPSHPTVEQSNKAANSLGFGYLNDESINTILQNETKKCLEDMVDIKRELLRQQSDLKVTVSAFRQRRGKYLLFNWMASPDFNHTTLYSSLRNLSELPETCERFDDSW